MPFEMYREIAVGKRGNLKDWITDSDVETALILDEDIDYSLFQDVVDQGVCARSHGS